MSASDKSKLDNADDTYALKSIYGDTTINVGRKAGTTVGSYSTAEGYNTTASGKYSHSEGAGTESSGWYSHSEGYITTANASYAHAEGYNTTASGTFSHAGGYNSTAQQQGAFAHGTYVDSTKMEEAAFGKYNKSSSDTLFSIGDGTDDSARHNAFEITTDGGKLHDKDIATTDLIPTSLPANGGNADTVDDMHASDFRQITKYEPQITTLPTPTSEIDYCVFGADSTFPYPYGNLSIRYGAHAAEYVAIYYTTGNDRDVWYNVAFSGNWTGWRRLCGQLSPIVVPEGTSANTCIGEPMKIVSYICTGAGFVDLPSQALLEYAGGISTAQGTIIAYNFNGKGAAGQDLMWCKQVFISAHFGRTFTRYIDGTSIGEWTYEDTKQQNPNLIINPDFKINQRGQSSYTGAVYGVDRWKGIYGAEIVTVVDDGIELNVGNNQQIVQYIEISIPAGTMLTYSSYSEYVGTVSDDSYRTFYVSGKKMMGHGKTLSHLVMVMVIRVKLISHNQGLHQITIPCYKF